MRRRPGWLQRSSVSKPLSNSINSIPDVTSQIFVLRKSPKASRSPDRVERMLRDALAKFQPTDFTLPEATRFDPRWNPVPPA